MNAPTMISVNGRPARVRVEGSSENPPVLMLHGLGRSLEDWEPQYARLSGAYRVIGLDLPGFGYSARLPEQATLEVLARGVCETLDALDERRPSHVLGNSLGGAVAAQYLALEPDRVASLVLVDSAGFGSDVAKLLRIYVLPGIGRLAARHTTRAGAKLTEQLIFADPAFVTKERIDLAMDFARQPDSGDVLYEILRAYVGIRGARAEPRSKLVAAANQHPRPTLIVWGGSDRVLPAHHLRAAPNLYPHAETHLFPGVGHMPQLECPDEFASVVSAFLAGASTVDKVE